MKGMITFCFLALATFVSASELKIATVDLQRLTREYHRAQEVAQELERRHVAFVKELEGMRLEGMKLVKETEQLQELSRDTTLSAAERENKRKSLDMKLTDLRSFQVQYDEAKTQREAELQSQAAQSSKRVLDEIMGATRGIGEREGFNLVLNMNLSNPAVSTVLFSRNVSDITDSVLASLNAGAPSRIPPVTNTNPNLKRQDSR
jgi:Skp family chaperone for outer membrane proteins